MNIYLISANSYHLINKEVNGIIQNNEYISFNLNKDTIDDVIKEASYFSLTNDLKYIVVNNAALFGSQKSLEKDVLELVSYLDNPNPNTVIIFTTLNGIDLRKKIVKTIKEKYKLINIAPLDKKSMLEETKKIALANGYKIDNETCNYIVNNSYDSLDVIYNELEKIFTYYNEKGIISYNDVKKIVGSSLDNNNFHFVSAIIDKNLQLAIKIYKDLKVYKVEPIALIILLAREYRLMYYVKKYYDKRMTLSAIAKSLNLLDWQVNKLYNNAIKYNELELLDNLKLLADLDYGIKTGELDKECAIYSFMISACE